MTEQARRLREQIRALLLAQGSLSPRQRPCGAPLSLPHAYALLELLQSDGSLSVSDLAQKLSIDRTNVSRLCARMQDAGELLRTQDPRDARTWRLSLTPQGHKAATKLDKSSLRRFEGLTARLGDDAEAVMQALERLNEAMIIMGSEKESQ